MSRKPTRNNSAISFDADTVVDTTRTVTKLRTKLEHKQIIVDLGPMRRKTRKLHDRLDFYPGGVDGFIISCILGSQRPSQSPDELRRRVYNDVASAWDEHKAKEGKTDRVVSGLALFNGGSIDDFEFNDAMHIAYYMSEHIDAQMEMVRITYGEFALVESELSFTKFGSVVMTVHY